MDIRDKRAIPKVSIIIVNWNGLEDTIQCLGLLKRVTYSVILVDC